MQIMSNALSRAAVGPQTAAWIAVLLQAMHEIIGNSVAFFFRQFVAKSAHKFARASKRECDSEAQELPTGAHPIMRT